MPEPLVSIIVPTYNRPEMLLRALESIAAQTVQDFEVLVINDGGTDVRQIVSRFRFARYLSHETNRRLPAARNTAIRQARGKYIAYLDDDDLWYPQHLYTCLSAIQFTGRRFVYSDCLYWYNEQELKWELSQDYSREVLLQHNVTPVISVMHERSLFDQAGLFDESLPNHEDYDLWLRMSEITDFHHIPFVTCAYSKRGGSGQLSANPYVMADGLLFVQRRYKERQAQAATRTQVIEQAEAPASGEAKILVFCPTYEKDGLDMLWPDTKACLDVLQAPAGATVDKVIARDNPYPGAGHKNTLHQYKQAQQQAIEGGYAALLTVEHDMLPPPDALIKLWETDAPVVYALYQLRHSIKGVNAFRKVEGHATAKESLTNHPDLYREAAERGWAEVGGVGFGCTLIKRAALATIPFRGSRDNDPPDWFFAMDCEKEKVKQVARFDVLCGHIDDDGTILWPDIRLTTRIEPKQPFNCWVNGVSLPFAPGKIYEIPTKEAEDLERAGWVRTEATQEKIRRPRQAQPRTRVI